MFQWEAVTAPMSGQRNQAQRGSASPNQNVEDQTVPKESPSHTVSCCEALRTVVVGVNLASPELSLHTETSWGARASPGSVPHSVS